MSERIISYADLSIINSALRSISTDMTGVHSELGSLNIKHDLLEDELVKLATSFADFVEADLKHKSLQLAETRQGNLKQDLQIKFGYYAEVRRMAVGIMQGVDSGVVNDDTLKYTTEEVMIKAPGYWLAPTLVSLAAWIRNDRRTCEKALQEALKRDDYKTTLLYMLLMRRLARNEASLQWLSRYFLHQDPYRLDREFVVILEAVATGVFPPSARQLMMKNVKGWLDELTKGDTFINEQKAQWLIFFGTLGPSVEGKYPLLSSYSANWSSLEHSLKEAKTHAIVHSYFEGVIAASADLSKTTKVQLDEILSLLVTNFDDEELPLQEQVRLNQLIIQTEGDKKAAQAIFDAEKNIFNEQVDFLQLITNASFNPEQAGVTKVTQALAISIGLPWITESYNTFVAQARNAVPQAVMLDIDDFKVSSTDGSEEAELLQAQETFYQTALKAGLDRVPFPYAGIIIGALICLGSFWAFNSHVAAGLICLAVGGIIIWIAMHDYGKKRKSVSERIKSRKLNAKEVLRGCIAEIVDYRSECHIEDRKAEQVLQLLTSMTPENFSSISKDTARSII